MIGNITAGLLGGAAVPVAITVDYLVLAGGGGGGNQYEQGGSGGGGGMRCTVGATGGSGSLETALSLMTLNDYSVKVGAGGAINGQGGSSIFSTITSTGGGYGAPDRYTAAGNGGSGGGSGDVAATSPAGSASPSNQGYNGGVTNGINNPTSWTDGGSGGGAGGTPSGNNNGSGATTSISGTSTTYGVGGRMQDGTGGANTGKGGGVNNGITNGAAFTPPDTGAGFAGGSGIVILKYLNTFTPTFSGGVTQTTSTSGSYKISIITAAGVSDTVKWA